MWAIDLSAEEESVSQQVEHIHRQRLLCLLNITHFTIWLLHLKVSSGSFFENEKVTVRNPFWPFLLPTHWSTRAMNPSPTEIEMR